MTEELQGFLEKFHSYVMPTAENESRNLHLCKPEAADKRHETDGRAVSRSDGRQL